MLPQLPLPRTIDLALLPSLPVIRKDVFAILTITTFDNHTLFWTIARLLLFIRNEKSVGRDGPLFALAPGLSKLFESLPVELKSGLESLLEELELQPE